MEKKSLLKLLAIILLSLSWVVYAVAVPATRSSMMGKMDPPAVLQDQLVNKEQVFDMEGGEEERKMMLEIVDYPGARANPAHDPKSPGKP